MTGDPGPCVECGIPWLECGGSEGYQGRAFRGMDRCCAWCEHHRPGEVLDPELAAIKEAAKRKAAGA